MPLLSHRVWRPSLDANDADKVFLVGSRGVMGVSLTDLFCARRCVFEADGKAAEEKRRSRMGSSAAPETSTEVPSSSPMEDGPGGTLRVTQVGPKPALCNTRTKAGDLIEFRWVVVSTGEVTILT